MAPRSPRRAGIAILIVVGDSHQEDRDLWYPAATYLWMSESAATAAGGIPLIYILLVGLIAGWATGKIMKGSGYGVLVDIVLGIVGAFVGSRVLGLLGLYTSGGLIANILVAILGAVIIVALVRLVKKA